MFRNAHQLHMGVAHLLHVGGQLVSRLHICIETILLRAVFLAPGPKVDFINAHGAGDRVGLAALFHPLAVRPSVSFDVGGHGGGAGAVFRAVGVGVGFEQNLARLGGDGKFVELAGCHAGDKALPDTGLGQLGHGSDFRVPAVEIAYQMNGTGVGGPHRKVVSRPASIGFGVRAQLFKDLVVGACSEEVAVQIGYESRFSGF